MALIRGRAVFADVTNVTRAPEEAGSSLADNASSALGSGGSGSNRPRLQKAKELLRQSHDMPVQAPRALQPAASPSATAPLLAMPSSSTTAPGTAPPVLSGGTMPAAVVVPCAPVASAGPAQLRQQQGGKGDTSERRDIAELAGRLQAVALDGAVTTEHSEALGLSHTRATSSGQSRLSASHPNLRAAIPGHLSGGRGTRRVSPGVRRTSPGPSPGLSGGARHSMGRVRRSSPGPGAAARTDLESGGRSADVASFASAATMDREERRADPTLDYRLVTYAEMCRRLGDQDLTETQLWSRWQNLHPVEAGVIIAGLTGADPEPSTAGTSAARSFEPEPRRGPTHASAEEPPSPKAAGTGSRHAPAATAGTTPATAPALAAATPNVVQGPGSRVMFDGAARIGPDWPYEQTHMAALFEGMRHVPPGTPDEQIDAVLADLVDSLLQASHAESQRHLPASEDLVARLGNNQRESILEWLVQACDIMRLNDGVLYSTVLTLDRYCAAAREPLPMERMQKVLMAVICTVLKTCTVSDEVCMPLRDLLLHLCRRQVNFEEILAMEHRVLQTLQFSGLSAPTPLDFLDAFCTPLLGCGETIESNVPRCLANFLIQLSLFNAGLHYRQPHAVLAAAGVYVALCGLRVPHVVHQALLHDVAAVCPEIPDVATRVAACASELHGLWLEFVAMQGSRVPCLLRKFNGSRLHTAVILGPPATLLSVHTVCPVRSSGATANAGCSSPAERRLPLAQAGKNEKQSTIIEVEWSSWKSTGKQWDQFIADELQDRLGVMHLDTRGASLKFFDKQGLEVSTVPSMDRFPVTVHFLVVGRGGTQAAQQTPGMARILPTRAW